MPTWIALRLLHLSLSARCPDWHTRPAVILDQGRVRDASPAAMQAGIRLGMRAGGVRALCPQTLCLPDSPQADTHLRQKAALALMQFTPQVSQARHDTLLLDVSASLLLFRGIRNLCRLVRNTLHGMALAARLAVAPTASGAWLLAQAATAARRRCLTLPTLHRHLDSLPCTPLPAAAAHLEWLRDIGCQTLGALRQLPRAGLQRRTHTDLLHELDAAYGATADPQHWLSPPAVFHVHAELSDWLDHAPAIQHAADRLIVQLCDWLTTHKLAASHLEFLLHHERRRQAHAPTPLALRTAIPTWQASYLSGLLREHLQRITLSAPVIAISLRVIDTEPMASAADDLFPEPGGSPAQRTQVLEQLAARLGSDRLLRPAPRDDHRPDAANHWLALHLWPTSIRPAPIPPTRATACQADPAVSGALPLSTTTAPTNAMASHLPERPLWLLPTPTPLTMQGHYPAYAGQPLRLLRGPERIEDGWWDTPMLRDYFVAQSPDGALYWLFRERSRDSGWFLHGLFG